MKPLAGQLLILLLLTLPLSAVGQRVQRPDFLAIVHLRGGERIKGTLNEVANGVINFAIYERYHIRELGNGKKFHYKHLEYGQGSFPLDQVEWVVIKRTDKRKAIRTGMVIGGLTGGYFGYQSSQKSRFRSPILAGISIALSAATVSGLGAVIGSVIGGSSRRVIRPLDRDNPAESLERQLRPFTEVYLDDMRFNQ